MTEQPAGARDELALLRRRLEVVEDRSARSQEYLTGGVHLAFWLATLVTLGLPFLWQRVSVSSADPAMESVVGWRLPFHQGIAYSVDVPVLARLAPLLVIVAAIGSTIARKPVSRVIAIVIDAVVAVLCLVAAQLCHQHLSDSSDDPPLSGPGSGWWVVALLLAVWAGYVGWLRALDRSGVVSA